MADRAQTRKSWWSKVVSLFRPRNSDSHSPTPIERRQAVRVATKRQVQYQLIGENENCQHALTLRNLSPTGMGLLLDQPLLPGSLMHVRMPLAHGYSLMACVIHSRNIEKTTWELGCSFIRELSPNEMESLL